MFFGFNGTILRVDLSTSNIWIEKKPPTFYRKYLGGGGIGSYYVTKENKPGLDAFNPETLLVFSTSVVTGVVVPGFSRHSVTSISPLTGGIFDSEAGGFWGRELKSAGFDAIVVSGKSKNPVYIFIKDGIATILDATLLWGLDTGELHEKFYQKYKDENFHVLSIGQAGENRVRFSCIINDLHSAHGRGGLGAVMGSKNLKAIVVKGTNRIQFANEDALIKFAKEFNNKFLDFSPCKGLRLIGTSRSISPMNESGQLPTLNWQKGFFEQAPQICGTVLKEHVVTHKGCFGCPIRCKKAVKLDGVYDVDPRFGGPEYESLAALGAYTGISDLPTLIKANELCNRYALDTISTGSVISFAMECYSKDLLGKYFDANLYFGNKDVLIPMIHKIAMREGLGNFLAEGTKRFSELLGKEAEKIAVHVKGVDFPAHEPRVKKSLALAYAVSPIGPDHMASEHDFSISPDTPESVAGRLMELGIYDRLDINSLDEKKALFFYYTQIAYSLLNCLDVCMFCVSPTRVIKYEEIVKIVEWATAWETSLFELMKVGERRIILMRDFNSKAGLNRLDDMLPERMFQGLENGINQGEKIDRYSFEKVLDFYYQIAGWDKNGIPMQSKLFELQLF